MKIFFRKFLSLMIVVAILAAPIELALGNECHCAENNHPAQALCESCQVQNISSKPTNCCCRFATADSSQDDGITIESESKTNDQHKSCPCRCAFMINDTTGIVVDNVNISMDVIISVHQFYPDTYHSSDWVLTILRPPIC